MHILMINQFFWPDLAPTGQYLSDLARHLSAEGHEITVICSREAYGQSEEDGQAAPPVRVIRVPGVPFRRTFVSRLLSYATFLAGSIWSAFTIRRPDMVLTMTTPPLLSLTGTLLKSLRGTRHFIWEMDMFPDALITTGSLHERSVLVRFLSRVQKASQRRADGIVALGPCMQARLIGNGVPAELIYVAENWADSRVIAPAPYRSSGPLHILYSGNLGMAHDIGTIADALRYFRNDSRFLFSFAGGGVGKARLQRVCEAESIQNVHFLPYVSRENMSEHLAQADLGLVTELPTCLGTVVPSKIYGLMAAARPVLFVGPQAATPALVIARFTSGWQINPGDSWALITLLKQIAQNRTEARQRGQQARTAFEQNYDTPMGVRRVAAALGLTAEETAKAWHVAAVGSGIPTDG
jgi:colanic acid biosynthesis glycosyl transferase WcaI